MTGDGARREQSWRDPELWAALWEEMSGKGGPAEEKVGAKVLRQGHIWCVRATEKSPRGLDLGKAGGWAGHPGPCSAAERTRCCSERGARTLGDLGLMSLRDQSGRWVENELEGARLAARRPGQSWEAGAPAWLLCGP